MPGTFMFRYGCPSAGAGSDPATLAATAVARRLSWIGTGLLSLIRGLGDRQTFTFFCLGPLNSPPYLAVKSRKATMTFRIMQRLALALTLAAVPGHADTNILQIFYAGPGGKVFSMWRNPDGIWSGEQNLGGSVDQGSVFGCITAAQVPGTNFLQIFYRGLDG